MKSTPMRLIGPKKKGEKKKEEKKNLSHFTVDTFAWHCRILQHGDVFISPIGITIFHTSAVFVHYACCGNPKAPPP